MKRKTGEQTTPGLDTVPIFLQKSYHMIDTCDPQIASWSDDGESFVVEDAEKLASDIIPKFFKHNNWSSFVRQLNFYGFRKVRSDPLLELINKPETKQWRFHHKFFKRGRIELLKEIRKPGQNAVEKEEVDALRKELEDLKEKFSVVSSQVEKLTGLMQTILLSQGTGSNISLKVPTSCTFRAAADSCKESISNVLQSQQLHCGSLDQTVVRQEIENTILGGVETPSMPHMFQVNSAVSQSAAPPEPSTHTSHPSHSSVGDAGARTKKCKVGTASAIPAPDVNALCAYPSKYSNSVSNPLDDNIILEEVASALSCGTEALDIGHQQLHSDSLVDDMILDMITTEELDNMNGFASTFQKPALTQTVDHHGTMTSLGNMSTGVKQVQTAPTEGSVVARSA
uniref:HSF-type DNA-binding domain-containing protein n=1 Tax=Trieres chinensis TaxID=1514140 RepID=A0A7S1ZS64_TRICV|mmetsp:Transcript_32049/g.65413  ORF Transcript_32049/g.65413 Transcript_32049/m.65413 type:complete len:398 (+) Transcript_32049:134-1327(+)|eukprot:CAMPEP_0183308762 /NCGR_PEP_ID=MMETSP0160_2-20130417/22445_1 /TAXON_ID=2839 ORGANISM="Odontella Sinensis, Strain Grunow 1884" /NCGR_SAMPLE_ID=MMETSP0160_2 /ASSEMBLY_ACC=CAM_ASM_000250 /LENGTH=397 /DNA_ID=CAMNT_0025472651 /DNA_START=131 /DNA_END=1324 /DNA_ORIENTATION=-